jgi:hypothetical protein
VAPERPFCSLLSAPTLAAHVVDTPHRAPEIARGTATAGNLLRHTAALSPRPSSPRHRVTTAARLPGPQLASGPLEDGDGAPASWPPAAPSPRRCSRAESRSFRPVRAEMAENEAKNMHSTNASERIGGHADSRANATRRIRIRRQIEAISTPMDSSRSVSLSVCACLSQRHRRLAHPLHLRSHASASSASTLPDHALPLSSACTLRFHRDATVAASFLSTSTGIHQCLHLSSKEILSCPHAPTSLGVLAFSCLSPRT